MSSLCLLNMKVVMQLCGINCVVALKYMKENNSITNKSNQEARQK